MTDDSNTPDPGTEVAQPDHSTDTIPDYVFWDPEEDQDTPEPEAPEMTEDDGKPDEAEDPEEVTEEAEAEEAEAPKSKVKIELPDGTKIDAEEAAKGYLRQSDYTRKATEVAEQRKTLEAQTNRINGITEAFIDHLSKMIPPPPDQALAYRDPNAYTRQKAAHDAAVAQVQKLVQMGEQVKETTKTLSDADRRKKIAEEDRKLAERFPQTAEPKGRQAFFNAAAEAAQSAGFTLEELSGVTDHRMFTLAHWAKIGMEAQQAKAKAKEKAAAAPPVAPNKPAQNGKPRNKPMPKRFGSIRDAVKVDWV